MTEWTFSPLQFVLVLLATALGGGLIGGALVATYASWRAEQDARAAVRQIRTRELLEFYER
ncbi:hypothetical protein [Deinococcus multiflagellatus]|uniref:Uncharacterized protein n=1 Tax=Deinococcus multiflagellatus TaxID=1656887 RepID=A0ABW1ZRH2_9DEIO|nr:hypothetical protein [Deinococcus multiflagellatus]MBZ9715530.1 hypothetical protein [Deinococcus multiflagellatus]